MDDEGVLPREFCDYRLDRELGRGAMGVVYAATHRTTGQQVAVKLLAHGRRGDPGTFQRFQREGRLAAAIDHPRCVFVHAADECDGTPFIAMEAMPGRTLKHEVAERGPLPVHVAVDMALQVLEGLQAAELKGVVHRDVKPSNCFLDEDGSVKVGDFGLAKLLLGDAELTQPGDIVGTPLYASPEQLRGREVDARSDQYSLGATLYHLLAGRPPHPHAHVGEVIAAITSDPVARLRPARPEIPRALERTVLRMLAKDPARRFRDLAAVRSALLPHSSRAPTRLDLGLRVTAVGLDMLVYFAVGRIVMFLGWIPGMTVPIQELYFWPPLLLLYYQLTEGLTGRSPGKALLRLVVMRDDGQPLGFLRALARNLVAVLWIVATGLLLRFLGGSTPFPLPYVPLFPGIVYRWFDLGWMLGLVAMCSTMRHSNGFRGLHELLSGTRVHAVGPRGRPARTPIVRAAEPPEPIGPSSRDGRRLGSYEVRGQLAVTTEGELLLGRDAALDRAVAILVGTPGATPLDPSRRAVRRTTRLRWLQAGSADGHAWDAFEAPSAIALDDATGRTSWSELRWQLRDLALELSAGETDGTLPRRLTPGQVRVRPDGRLLLLDWPLGPADDTASALTPQRLMTGVAKRALETVDTATLPARARALLEDADADRPAPALRAIVSSLEASCASEPDVSRRLRLVTLLPFLALLAPLVVVLGFRVHSYATAGDEQSIARALFTLAWAEPDHPFAAGRLQALKQHTHIALADRETARLYLVAIGWAVGIDSSVSLADRYGKQASVDGEPLEDLVLRFREKVGQPTAEQVARARRVLAAADRDNAIHESARTYALLLACLAAWSLAVAVPLRGGLVFRLMGVSVRLANGEVPSRTRRLARAVLCWAPALVLAALAMGGHHDGWLTARLGPWSDDPDLAVWQPAMTLQMAVCVVLAGQGLFAFLHPHRALHDRLAGTMLSVE